MKLPLNLEAGDLESPLTLLVVEDDPMILELTTAILKQAGYRVLSAGDGIGGSVLFARHYEEIDALVTDISLPGMRGLEFAQFARNIRGDLKVLFASGSMEQENALTRIPGSRYLPKPFTCEELLQTVQAMMSEGLGGRREFRCAPEPVHRVVI
jgi:DNA-binding response OmpR family regulator